MQGLIAVAERGWLPDAVLRFGIRVLLKRRLRRERAGGAEAQAASLAELLEAMRAAPVAVDTDAANRQHYEVPAAFYEHVLGPRLKYSACLWPEDVTTLAAAEEAMLALTCERAELADGQDILELGCGWGSLTLWMAEHYPASRIVAVSNSVSQAEFIRVRAAERGLANIECITVDVREFDTRRRFDRVVSIEMFEHMRNWEQLMHRIASWLVPTGKLFIHIFCHRDNAYLFDTEGTGDWMGRHFFTGGLMPAEDLPQHFQKDLTLSSQWCVNGRHYARTCRAWLRQLDGDRTVVRDIFVGEYGPGEAARQVQRWRLFFMACEELFGWNAGEEWFVTHCLFAQLTVEADA
ncbi:MAG: SAM-dependent methyltransferase [Gammaproteobacteria bacterium]